MAPFSTDDIQLIRAALARRGSDRDAALFEVAISSMLRVSDLIALRVGDVVDHAGVIRQTAFTAQTKTARRVAFNLSDAARCALAPLVADSEPGSYVFPGAKPHTHVSDQTFRAVIKWIADAVLGRDPRQYACHSTRRTGAAHVYANTKDVAIVGKLLGHASLAHTGAYLGITEADALATARQFAL